LLWSLLLAAYFALRLPNLRGMPAFVDETTYARWTQVILKSHWANPFVSMSDAKLPLHYWLLAATRSLAQDPILAGRLLSVLIGALALPPISPLCRELLRLSNNNNPLHNRLFPLLSAALLITCPYVALQQRMILAEAL